MPANTVENLKPTIMSNLLEKIENTVVEYIKQSNILYESNSTKDWNKIEKNLDVVAQLKSQILINVSVGNYKKALKLLVLFREYMENIKKDIS